MQTHAGPVMDYNVINGCSIMKLTFFRGGGQPPPQTSPPYGRY